MSNALIEFEIKGSGKLKAWTYIRVYAGVLNTIDNL